MKFTQLCRASPLNKSIYSNILVDGAFLIHFYRFPYTASQHQALQGKSVPLHCFQLEYSILDHNVKQRCAMQCDVLTFVPVSVFFQSCVLLYGEPVPIQ